MSLEIPSTEIVTDYEKKIDKNTNNTTEKTNYLKRNQKIQEIKEKAEKVHELDKVEAELVLNLSLESPENIIDIIQNKKEFETMYKEMGALLIDWGEHINKEEIEKIQKKEPKKLRDYLVLSFNDNPTKFKNLYLILDGINRNWLQNFFNEKEVQFKNKIISLEQKLQEEFSSVQHIPDSEQKLLNIIKEYYKQ